MPVGAAVGYILGGSLSEWIGWRQAFLVCGAPGILIALLIVTVKDPGKDPGGAEDKYGEQLSWVAALKLLIRNKRFVTAVLGNVLVVWAIGAM